jgi:hypothetical protein
MSAFLRVVLTPLPAFHFRTLPYTTFDVPSLEKIQGPTPTLVKNLARQ